MSSQLFLSNTSVQSTATGSTTSKKQSGDKAAIQSVLGYSDFQISVESL